MSGSEEETQLIYRAIAGDSDSFGQLVEAYQRAIFCLVLGKVNDYESARDLTQDTFVQAYLSLHRLSNAERFAPWLYGIARNLANDYMRRKRDFVSLDDAFRDGEDMDYLQIPPPDEERIEMRQRILEAIERLPDKSREAVLLFYGEGYRYREIAALLGVSSGVVRSRLEYGRKKLREELTMMVKETLQKEGPGPEFSGKVLQHVPGIERTSPYISSLASMLRYRVRPLSIHATTRSLTDEILLVTSGDAFRFYYGTDPSVRFVCSQNLLITVCEHWGLSYTWQHSGSFDASWEVLTSAIDGGCPALVACRVDPTADNVWIPLRQYASWGLAVGYDDKTKAVVLAPAGRCSTSYGTEIVEDFRDRWEGWVPGPEGWVKYPIFVPGARQAKPRPYASMLERAARMANEGEVQVAGKTYVSGIEGYERWAHDLRDGRIFEQADGERLDSLAAANLEMVWLLRPTRRMAAMHLFARSAKHQGEVRDLFRKAAGLYLDVAEPVALELEETLTETSEIRDDPTHRVSHLEVTKTLLRTPEARMKAADLVAQIAEKEREASCCLSRIIKLGEIPL